MAAVGLTAKEARACKAWADLAVSSGLGRISAYLREHPHLIPAVEQFLS